MPHFNDPEFSRNLGFETEYEQEVLLNSKVAIAGAGGDGGMLAVALARSGVGELRLADPDPFESENVNRQACATSKTVGVNKAEAVGRYIRDINPGIIVNIYDEGITRQNAAEFVKGADLLIDETEFTMHVIGVMLARAARTEGIPNLMAMNIGFGATVTSFSPNGYTFEQMLGLSEHAHLDEIEAAEPDISGWLPYIPPYADLDVFKKVASGEKSAPSNVQGVAMAASLASTQALLHLWNGRNNRPQPVFAPQVAVMDAMTLRSKDNLRLGKVAHYRSLAKVVINNALRRNPKASY